MKVCVETGLTFVPTIGFSTMHKVLSVKQFLILKSIHITEHPPLFP